MKFDRELQHEILCELQRIHPFSAGHKELLGKLTEISGSDEILLGSTLVYLEEHGLITSGSVVPGFDGKIYFDSSKIKISAKGLDFLEDDGGLGAILGAVVIKLHCDTLEALEGFILHGSADPADKQKLLTRL